MITELKSFLNIGSIVFSHCYKMVPILASRFLIKNIVIFDVVAQPYIKIDYLK